MIQKLITEISIHRPFVPNGGWAHTAVLSPEITELFEAGALGALSEDGKPLGPANAQHEEIRKRGRGAFSVWKSTLYFSSSDHSDCNTNGRTYTLAAVDFSRASAPYQLAKQRLSDDGEEVLELIRRNSERNNSFFLNFFGYYNVVSAMLQRNGIEFPESAIELGTGERPYTALRFLLEGTKLFVVNDVMRVTSLSEKTFIRDVRALLTLVAPDKRERLDQIVSDRDNDQVAIRGLDVHDQQPFEDLKVPANNFDLIFSTSVLEHVMKPRQVVEQMHALLKPGGHAYHSIDLRDHRDFSDPLAFLQLTAEDYAAINTENRLRASDWLSLFADAGFELLECEYGAFKSAVERVHKYSFARPSEPWVDAKMRAQFCSPFDAKELEDLSTLAVRILCRKKG